MIWTISSNLKVLKRRYTTTDANSLSAVISHSNFSRSGFPHCYIWQLKGQAPQYLTDFCTPLSAVTSRQRLRSASRQLLDVRRYRLSSFGRRAFSVAGPSVWNSLPEYLRDPAVGRDSFRKQLKTFLFAMY